MSLGPNPLYDLIPAGLVAPRNPLDAYAYTFHAGDIVWFTLDRRQWRLGQVTSTNPNGSIDPSTGRKFWTGIFVHDGAIHSTFFIPLYGTVKPDGPYVRRLLSWARILPEEDYEIAAMVQDFQLELARIKISECLEYAIASGVQAQAQAKQELGTRGAITGH